MAKKKAEKAEPTKAEETEPSTEPSTEEEKKASAAAEETPPKTEAKTAADANVPPDFGEDQISDFLTEEPEEEEEGEIKDSDEPSIPTPTPTPEKGKEEEPPKEEAKPKDEPTPAAEKPEGEKTAAEAPPKVEAIPTEVVPSAPEQVKPEPTSPPEPEPVAVEPAAPTLTLEEQTKAYEDWREGQETELAKTRYAVSEEEAEKMDISPEAAQAYSKGLSRVYMDAVTGAIGHITKAMPGLLEAALKIRDDTTAAETDFYTAWPKLNGKEHREVVGRLGRNYRSLNPSVSKEDFIRDVGAQAMIALRISADDVPVVLSESQVPPAPSAPFKPAGSAPPGGGPQTPANVYTKLSKDFDEEEEELDLG